MGTIWLISEGKKDHHIVAALLKHRYPQVRVRPLFPTVNNPNVSLLAAELERLIKQARSNYKRGDCIAVLHDADLLSRPHNRQDYEKIKAICSSYKEHVKHIIAADEIESWLLADEKLCAWLGERPKNYDHQKQPSLILESWLDKAGKPKYRLDTLPRILQNCNGTGDNHSESLKTALEHLIDAPCTRA